MLIATASDDRQEMGESRDQWVINEPGVAALGRRATADLLCAKRRFERAHILLGVAGKDARRQNAKAIGQMDRRSPSSDYNMALSVWPSNTWGGI